MCNNNTSIIGKQDFLQNLYEYIYLANIFIHSNLQIRKHLTLQFSWFLYVYSKSLHGFLNILLFIYTPFYENEL